MTTKLFLPPENIKVGRFWVCVVVFVYYFVYCSGYSSTNKLIPADIVLVGYELVVLVGVRNVGCI